MLGSLPAVHWKAKVAIQWALARLPYGEQVNFQLQKLNGHYSDGRLNQKIREARETLRYLSRFVKLQGATVVEVGTGWNLTGPLAMVELGAKTVHTYDIHRHLRSDLSRRSARLMGLNLDQAMGSIEYHAPADASRTGQPGQSVDLFYSHEVLEHIPRKEIVAILNESKRVLRPGGIVYHDIHPRDHYAGWGKNVSKVNFLRYSDRAWDFWVQNRISYHNRMRAREFLDIFREGGLKAVDVAVEVDPGDVALLRGGFPLNKKFTSMPPEDLAPYSLRVVYTVA